MKSSYIKTVDVFPDIRPIHELFIEEAERHPDRIAVIDAGTIISYRVLAERSENLAKELIHRAIPANTAVGVIFERSADYITAVVAVLRSGRHYVPIAVSTPLERIGYILHDADCHAVLTNAVNAKKIASIPVEIISVNDCYDVKYESALPEVSPDSLAYLIYTSGSTGTPKGVEIEHRSLTNLCLWHKKTFPESGEYHSTLSAGVGFDASVWEIWSNLTSGATIHIIPDDLLFQPQKLADWLTINKINHCFLPTPLAEMALDSKWTGNNSLKCLFCGGEKLNRKPGTNFPATLFNLYGPTECTVIASWSSFPAGSSNDNVPPHIGVPVSNFTIYIMDENLELTPAGETGEICIAGVGLARGYHNLHEQTEKAFVTSPACPGERIYRSGDLGRLNADGNLECFGRKDYQIKLRGFRIEPEEIESILSRHEKVAKCVVIERQHANSVKYLAAYILPKDTLQQSEREMGNELREIAERSLPAYMIPLTYTIIDQLPLTPNGKVDRKILPEPVFYGKMVNSDVESDVEDAVEKVVNIFQRILKVDGINQNDNFFLMGGHSLLATALCIDLEKEFKVKLEMHRIFADPTPTAIAKLLKNSTISGNEIPLVRTTQQERHRSQASVEQTAMWMQEMSVHGGSMYNVPLEIYLQGKVNHNILQQVFNLIIARHESLRTSFEYSGDTLFQNIAEPWNEEIKLLDLSNLPPEDSVKRYRGEINRHRFNHFDLSSKPLFSCLLVKLAEGDFRLIFTVHHLIFDGWSATLLFRELCELYVAISHNEKIPELPASLDYQDFCKWQLRFMKTAAFQRQLRYWQRQLDNSAATPPLPFQKQTSIGSRGEAQRRYVKIEEKITCGLKTLAVTHNSSLFMVLNALLQLQIHKYTGADDITTGTAIANRNIAGTENLLGLFINALAIRNKINGDNNFSGFLKQMQQTTLTAYENQDVPFDMLLKGCSGKNRKSNLFNISFLLQNLPWPSLGMDDIQMCYCELGSDKAKLDILIAVEERDNVLWGYYEYDSMLFNESDIERIYNDYLALAELILKDPEIKLTDINIPQNHAEYRDTCYIIGETALTQACAEILLQNNFYINGIFTDEPRTRTWAAERAIPCHAQQKNIITTVTSEVRPDYLFSIINSCILDEVVLQLPRKEVINYHDAPLPRYAGLYSTAWAIINHESEHGITWHKMTTEVDAGDILVQHRVTIHPDETSVSLNLKCTQEALNAFGELIAKIKHDALKPVVQDLTRRTYFPQFLRPDEACVINFNDSIEDISALKRALSFGEYDNPLGLIKIHINGQFYAVREMTVTRGNSRRDPGMIADIKNDHFTIAANGGLVHISEITGISGEQITIESLGLKNGEMLHDFPDREQLDRLYKECAVNEIFWIRRMRQLTLPVFELIDDHVSGENGENVQVELSSCSPEISPAAIFALFVGRVTGMSDFDIPVKIDNEASIAFPELFSDTVPARIKLNFEQSLDDNLKQVEKALQIIVTKKTFCRDIHIRYKKLCTWAPEDFVLHLNGSGMAQLELSSKYQILLEWFEAFKNDMRNGLGKALEKVSLLTKSENERLLHTWNQTECNFNITKPFIAIFDEQAKRLKNKTAVKSSEGTLTYLELDMLGGRLAKILEDKLADVQNRIIGILTDKTLEMAVGIIGTFKTGCTYLPLDVQRQNPDRIEAMIYDSGATIILSAVRDVSKIPGNIPEYLKFIEIDLAELRNVTDTITQVPEVKLDDTAYIMYTSGSTGVPKGVMITQLNMLNHNYSVIKDYGLNETDNVLQFSTLGFDISIEEIFPCWLIGGTLVFMPDGMLESPERLFKFIQTEKISFLDLPTSYWHEIAAMLKAPDFPECVKVVAIGGEKALPERFQQWKKFVSHTRLINTYGPTEVTVIATTGENPETIGKPMPNVHVYVLDNLRQPVPFGASGELYIAGAGVAKGYLNKPEETAAAFSENPFIPGECMYKTGDKVKFVAGGELAFLGRMDDQFKIRGFRIEPSDIESILIQHPDIYNAAVRVWLNERTGMKALAAYFIPSGKTWNIKSIREHARQLLPEYMVPMYYTVIESIPMTPNGKVNRKALPPPDTGADASELESKQTEPRNQLEMQLQLIYRKLLSHENFDINSNFFDIGGDSLSAIKLALEIEKNTGCKVPVEELYKSSSIVAIAGFIQSHGTRERIWTPVVRLGGEGNKTPLFLIHTTPGDILGYINLINHLDDRPVYGIQALGLHEPEHAHKTIESMAAYYIEQMIKIAPDGPYYLCGWCFGGIVAYEMAQQLIKMAKKVAFLCLIETYANRERTIWNDLLRIFALLKCGPAACKDYVKVKIMLKMGFDRNIEQLDFISSRFADVCDERTIANMKLVYRMNMEAASKYVMNYYDGRMTLMMVDTILRGVIPLPQYGWKNLCKKIDLYTFPYNHTDILKEPNVRTIAQKIIDSMVDTENKAC